ncbi:hypothetical protein [Kallotenue papyrolyticum]|uniref:hypothetical protein n=1 Tax=Kallotenue papyrolyticum TaxID=1325125 RepID=UPI0012690D43|nr:hypothetical protein [Kallotenue papyrolyticum]
MQSYDYAHRDGVETVTWERFVQLCHALAESLVQQQTDTIIGVARAGLLPATVIACAATSSPCGSTVAPRTRWSTPIRSGRSMWPLRSRAGGWR